MISCRALLLLFIVLGVLRPGALQAEAFLPVHEAFQVEADSDGDQLHYRFQIAPGYYLYKFRFGFEVNSASRGSLGEPVFSKAGKWKDDATFGRVEVFYDQVAVQVPVQTADEGFIEVDALYQGCADRGLCYVPQTFTAMFQVEAPDADSDPNALAGLGASGLDMAAGMEGMEPAVEGAPDLSLAQRLTNSAPPNLTSSPGSTTEQTAPPTATNEPSTPQAATNSTPRADDALGLQQFLSEAHLLAIIGVFYLIGLGLTFTPCVLPMVPILSGIIVGQGANLTRKRAALLSLAYVLGMAVTYAALGVVAGLTGAKLQVALQNPTLLFVFAGLFVVLSLAMFGFYELQLPQALQNRLNQVSQRQSGGQLLGVTLIGVISALVVSPCVSAPLAGALLYIGTSGDWLLGGCALLALGLGMGTPLLAIGVTGANFLPKAGGWMDNVKALFGIMLLAVALWLVKHLLPSALVWSLAGGFCLLAGLYFGALDPIQQQTGKFFKGIGLSLMVVGAGLILNAVMDLNPAPSSAPANTVEALPYQRITSMTELDAALSAASARQQPLMLDYYADWCSACIEMEHQTFSQPEVQQRLASHHWLQVDLTNNPQATALLQRFNIPGPPAILFFDPQGNEIEPARVLAYKTKARFLNHLSQHQL